MDEHRTRQEEEIEIDLKVLLCDFWKGFKKFWWLLLILCCVTTMVNYVRVAVQYSPMYESKVSFTVSTKIGYDETNTSYGFYYNQSTAEQLADIFPYILQSDVMKELVQNEFAESRPNGIVKAKAIPKSNLFTMTARSSNPRDAKDLLQVTLKYLPDVTKYVIGETKLNIIQPVTTPEEPCNKPNYRKCAAEGLFVGLVISGAMLFMYALLRKTIRKEEDFREILNIKCLGTVPKVRFKTHNKQIDCTVSVQNKRIDSYFKESIRSIALRIQRKMDEKHQKVLLVTSTLSNEGKSMVAANLALTLNERGKKVLLVDMDFRNPTIANYLKADDFVGMSDILLGKKSSAQGIVELQQGLYFMGEKNPKEKVARFFTSPALRNIIEQYKNEMDYIILDTPPCGIVSDAATLSELCDGILYVIRQDQIKCSQAIDAVQKVVSHGTPVLGGILNGVERSSHGYGYYGKYYSYGKYGYRKYGYRKYGEHQEK